MHRTILASIIFAIIIVSPAARTAYAQEAQIQEQPQEGAEAASNGEKDQIEEEKSTAREQESSEEIEEETSSNELSGTQKAVAKAIEMLPGKESLTQADESMILSARNAYEMLSAGQRTRLDSTRLEEAEDAFAAITGKQRYRYPARVRGEGTSFTYLCMFRGEIPTVSIVDPKGVVTVIASESDSVRTSSMSMVYTWNETYLQLDMKGMKEGEWQITASAPLDVQEKEYAGSSDDMLPAEDENTAEKWEVPSQADYSPFFWGVLIAACMGGALLMTRKREQKEIKKEESGKEPERDVSEFDRLRAERMAIYEQSQQKQEYDYEPDRPEEEVEVIDRDDDESITGRSVSISDFGLEDDADETRAIVPVKTGFYQNDRRRYS